MFTGGTIWILTHGRSLCRPFILFFRQWPWLRRCREPRCAFTRTRPQAPRGMARDLAVVVASGQGSPKWTARTDLFVASPGGEAMSMGGGWFCRFLLFVLFVFKHSIIIMSIISIIILFLFPRALGFACSQSLPREGDLETHGRTRKGQTFGC